MLYIKLFIILLFYTLIFGHINTANAETISYNYVLQRALENSFDIKISNVNVDISKTLVREAKSLYYPTLQSQIFSEYSHDLTDGTQSLSSVGSNVVTNGTKYQDLVTLSLSYNLYDFGIKGKKLSIAKKDVTSKKEAHNQTLRDLKLKIVGIYTDSLLTYKELKAKNEIYPIYKELFSQKEKLYTAGTASKIDIADEAIRMAKTSDEINTLKTRLKLLLKDLSFFTQEKYDVDTIEVSDFSEISETYVSNINFEKTEGQTYKLGVVKRDAKLDINDIDFEKTPDYKIYQLEIEKKEAELQILKRERLPSLGIYSSYNILGYDKNNLLESIGDLDSRSLAFGFSATMTPFDGFKREANIQKIEFEIEKLKLIRDQKTAELKNKYEKLNEEALYYDGQTENEEKLLFKIQDRLSMIEKLSQQKLIDQPSFLNQKTELIKQKLELEKSIINKVAAIKKLNIYSEEFEQIK